MTERYQVLKTRSYCERCEQEIANMPNAVFQCPMCKKRICSDCTNNMDEGPCLDCVKKGNKE